MYKITTEEEHAEMLVKFDKLMRKGEENVIAEESEEILAMALALQKYERRVIGL